MRRKYTIIGVLLVLAVGISQFASGSALKWIKVGSFQSKAIDSGNQGESAPGRYFMYYKYDHFEHEQEHALGWYIGVRSWTDESGAVHPVKINGAAHGTANETENTMPVPDNEGVTLHRYYRYQPPEITVDGFRLDDPFPQTGDAVAPDKIPGTADVMVESTINTSMGLTVHQKVLGWSQKYHDDYLIYDWTLENTGNVNLDDTIELPDQVLQDLYFSRIDFFEHNPGTRDEWVSSYGEYTTDTLRLMYNYPSRSDGSSYDNTGYVAPETGFLQNPYYMAEAWLHVDTAPGNTTDDWNQPGMTGVQHIDWSFNKLESHSLQPEQNQRMYDVMSDGFLGFDGTADVTGPNVRPGHHSPRFDERGKKYAKNFTWFTWLPGAYMAAGPWTLQPGESVRVVTARVIGSISVEKGWEVGKAWYNGTATWNGPDNLPPPYQDFPSLMGNANDQAKDNWVFSGKDSLFMNVNAAQWNVDHDYNIPVPPPAPSLNITSQPDKIIIEWGDESEQVSDFAGYRVYRSVGEPDPTVSENRLIGEWVKVFECGDGTDNPTITHQYEDTEAARGQAYYYYVSAFDDGQNNIGVDGKDRGRLESGKYMNRTTRAAHLLRPAGQLSEVRVVPNPYNINAEDLQYVGEPDKIIFMNVPPVCTIKIYTIRGDLVKVIEHTDGSGDQPWGDIPNDHMTTQSHQIPVSGLYIAYIETPEGKNTIVKFAIVR